MDAVGDHTVLLGQPSQELAGLGDFLLRRDRDLRIGGGPTVVNEFVRADLIDELHVAVVPITLGHGIRLWDGLRGLDLRQDVSTVLAESGVTHVMFSRR